MANLQKSITLGLMLALLWLSGYTLFVGTSLLYQTGQTPNIKADYIIVLTGGDQRIETALELFAQKYAPTLFVTGVYKGVTEEKIRNMATGTNALPECCIHLGYEARSTQQNAGETKAWLRDKEAKQIILVTANYHMHRARLEFEAALPEVSITPVAVKQPNLTPKHPRFWRMMVSEYHKSLWRAVALLLEKYT